MNPAGERLFARYAHAPNRLGYCGPAQTAALHELAATGRTDADVRAIARRFSGAWPYAALLAELAGIADPLDERVMRAYWTGGALLEQIDPGAFGRRLLELIGPRAGHYWQHLTDELLPEAMPTHGFHVFGVYPWTRLLGAPGAPPEVPLGVLDNCRIRWGQVVGLDATHVQVRTPRLRWDGAALALADPADPTIERLPRGDLVPDVQPGQWLALHWESVVEELTAEQVAELERRTRWQLDRTNDRLSVGRSPA